MSFVKSTLLALISFILFLVAICLVVAALMAWNQEFTAWLIHEITLVNKPAPFIFAAVILFIISIGLYGLATRSPNSSAIFTFESEKGPVSISLRAIEDYINRQFEGKSIVSSIRTKVSTSKDRKKLRVHANIGVRSEQNLKGAGDTVQREIAYRLSEGLGLDNVDKIAVSVDKIIASKTARPAPAKESGDESSS